MQQPPTGNSSGSYSSWGRKRLQSPRFADQESLSSIPTRKKKSPKGPGGRSQPVQSACRPIPVNYDDLHPAYKNFIASSSGQQAAKVAGLKIPTGTNTVIAASSLRNNQNKTIQHNHRFAGEQQNASNHAAHKIPSGDDGPVLTVDGSNQAGNENIHTHTVVCSPQISSISNNKLDLSNKNPIRIPQRQQKEAGANYMQTNGMISSSQVSQVTPSNDLSKFRASNSQTYSDHEHAAESKRIPGLRRYDSEDPRSNAGQIVHEFNSFSQQSRNYTDQLPSESSGYDCDKPSEYVTASDIGISSARQFSNATQLNGIDFFIDDASLFDSALLHNTVNQQTIPFKLVNNFDSPVIVSNDFRAIAGPQHAIESVRLQSTSTVMDGDAQQRHSDIGCQTSAVVKNSGTDLKMSSTMQFVLPSATSESTAVPRINSSATYNIHANSPTAPSISMTAKQPQATFSVPQSSSTDRSNICANSSSSLSQVQKNSSVVVLKSAVVTSNDSADSSSTFQLEAPPSSSAASLETTSSGNGNGEFNSPGAHNGVASNPTGFEDDTTSSELQFGKLSR